MKFHDHGFTDDLLNDIRKIMSGQNIEEKKKLDPVDQKALSKDFDDRDDKDIDNDGDTDSSDEYLHNRRKAVKKAMAKEELEQVDENKNAPSKENGGIAHQCATHVQHATYGEGRCIPGMHTIVETEKGEGVVTHYDVMFQGESGPVIVENVSVNELKIIASESHKHSKRK